VLRVRNKLKIAPGAIDNLNFTDSELAEIDKLSGDIGINLWARSSEIDE